MTLYEERIKNRQDLLAGRIPKRVPVMINITIEAACGLAGVDLRKAHFDWDLVDKAYSKVCDTFYSDSFPSRNIRFPAVYQLLGAKNWVMSSSGSVQHPEIETMKAEEYDSLIQDPYGFIVSTLLPRVCSSLATEDPAERAVNLAKANATHVKWTAAQNEIIGNLMRKHQYAPGMIAGPSIEAPFDFLADQLRGFKAITMDLRRRPEKIKQAVEAILPIMIKQGVTSGTKPGTIDFIPLHLAPYISMKQFEELFWPTLEELVIQLDKKGIACTLFAEQDWTRFAGYLERLPSSSIFIFEDGDPKVIKATAGKDHIICGFFDPTITLTKSKQDCIDVAKRLLDTCAPNGRFYFNFDKFVMDINSINVSKLQAVLEWVSVNANY